MVLGGAAAVLWLSARPTVESSTKERAGATTLRPSLGPDSAGVLFEGRF